MEQLTVLKAYLTPEVLEAEDCSTSDLEHLTLLGLLAPSFEDPATVPSPQNKKP